MKYTNICSYHKCNNSFSTNRKEKKYCSEECRGNAEKSRKWEKHKELREPKICKNCKAEFKPNNYGREYCDKCKKEVKKEQTKNWQEENEEEYKNSKKVYTSKASTKKKKKEDYLNINNTTKKESIENGVYKTEYTLEEDQYLLDNWDKFTKKELAKALNRTYASVNSRYKKLLKL